MREQRNQLGIELGVPSVDDVPLETLETVASLRALIDCDIDLIVDVGAHKGAFALTALRGLGAREVICFEPNLTLHDHLKRVLSGAPVELRAVALSDHLGDETFHIHADPSMSSLLDADCNVLQREFSTYDATATVAVQVKISTLDRELSGPYSHRRFFLKVDTQGNELDVLRGAQQSLTRCDGVLTEFMFLTPYKAQASFETLVEFLSSRGFHCCGALSITRRPSHRISAVDFLFLPTVPKWQ